MTIEYFHRRSSANDGFNTRCKECRGSKFGIIHPNRVLDKPEGFKYCTKCMELKSLSEFDTTPKEKDGHTQMCKVCRHKYYKDNFEYYVEKAKIRQQEKKEELKEYKANYYKENKENINKKNRINYRLNRKERIKKQQEYYFVNKESIQMYKQEYSKKNADKISEKHRIKYYENHEENLQKKKQYRIDNAEQIKAWRRSEHGKEVLRYHKQKRKSLKKKLISEFSIKDWEKCKKHFNQSCCYCGGKVKTLEQEHFVPLSHGGEYSINNIIPACRRCNSSKNNSNFFKWYPKQEYYSKQREQKILKYLNYKDHIQQLALL